MTGNGDLGDFLRARRASVSPTDAGLPGYGRRRVPGLRREELASQAGVSLAYYVRLEQGHDRNPSRQVRDALADALVLDEDARRHLDTLIDAADATARRPPSRPETVRPGLAHLLAEQVNTPALVLGRALDVLAANSLAQALHPSYRPGRNLVRDIFLDETARARYVDADRVQRDRVGSLREAAGALPADPRIVDVVGELSIRSEGFRTLWARHEVHTKGEGTKRFLHPEVGELALEYSFFGFPASNRQHLLFYYPVPASRDAESLALIGSLAAGSREHAAGAPVRGAPPS